MVRILTLAASIVLLFPVSSVAQLVPEGIHSSPNGPSEMCGITAGSPEEFEANVQADPSFEPMERSGQFRVYNRKEPFSQWVFSTRDYFAHPLATCRSLTTAADGGLYMSRKMKCEGEREVCDRAFIEFQELDQRMIRDVQGRSGS